jgi:hypothetical protein
MSLKEKSCEERSKRRAMNCSTQPDTNGSITRRGIVFEAVGKAIALSGSDRLYRETVGSAACPMIIVHLIL